MANRTGSWECKNCVKSQVKCVSLGNSVVLRSVDQAAKSKGESDLVTLAALEEPTKNHNGNYPIGNSNSNMVLFIVGKMFEVIMDRKRLLSGCS